MSSQRKLTEAEIAEVLAHLHKKVDTLWRDKIAAIYLAVGDVINFTHSLTITSMSDGADNSFIVQDNSQPAEADS